METIQLNKIYLSTEMMDANQISAYTIDFINDNHNMRFGTDTMLDISTQNSFVGGLSSTTFGNCSFVIGQKSSSGTRGYKVTSVERIMDGENLSAVKCTIDCDQKQQIDPLLDDLKPICSFDAAVSMGDIANVIEVDYSNNVITIDGSWFKIDSVVDFKQPEYIIGKYMYFSDYPEIGNVQSSSGLYSHVSGKSNKALADCSHVEGGYNKANGTYGHAEGKNTIAGWGAHAQGCATIASAENAHSGGRTAIARGITSIAHGVGVAATRTTSFAVGYAAASKDVRSFTWNGTPIKGYQNDDSKVFPDAGGVWKLDETLLNNDKNAIECLEASLDKLYKSHGEGTFNINPIGGLSGFYIGERSLYSILDDKADTDYLTFTAEQDGSTLSISLVGNPDKIQLEYSIYADDFWRDFDMTKVYSVAKSGDKIRIRSKDDQQNFSKSNKDYRTFILSGAWSVSGNLNFLISKNGGTPTLNDYAFYRLFKDQSALKNAGELYSLSFPSTASYNGIFTGCSALITAPIINMQKNGISGAFQYMYERCSQLSKAIIDFSGSDTTNLNWMFMRSNVPILVFKNIESSEIANLINNCQLFHLRNTEKSATFCCKDKDVLATYNADSKKWETTDLNS